MSAIDKLSRVSALSASDLLALYSATTGDDASVTLSVLLAWLQEQLSASGGYVTQYAAPNATGFTVTVAPPTAGDSVWLLLAPVAGYAAGTITLPSSPVDGQEVMVNTTQAVTTLTVNGATVNGAPTTLAANAFFRLRYDGAFNAFYRVG